MKLIPKLTLCAALSAGLAAASAVDAGLVDLIRDDGASISVASPALYPEGIETHPETGEFLLGSIRKGKVIAVDDDGNVRTLVDDPRLNSVVGIRVDAARGRLLVNNSDYGVAERSRPEDKFAKVALGVYDLKTGAPLDHVDLSALRPDRQNFANDLTLDDAGNAYVTDSLAAAIYKVTPDGKASVFLTHERFEGKGFNLNGIQYHPDGFLLVAKKSDGSLFKVDIDNPEGFTEIRLPQALVGTDGLVLAATNELIAITNRASGQAPNTIFKLRTMDNWRSAEIEARFETGDVYATTGTVRNGEVFVNYGQLHTLPASLKDPADKPLINTFTIQHIGSVARTN